MKLKKNIVTRINTPSTRVALASKLSCGEQAIYKHLKDNADNGRLTKIDALMAISEVTGTEIKKLIEPETAAA